MVVGSGTPVGETISLRAQQSALWVGGTRELPVLFLPFGPDPADGDFSFLITPVQLPYTAGLGGPLSLFRHSSLEALHRTDGGLQEEDHNIARSTPTLTGFSPHFPTPLSMFVRSPFSFPWIRCRAAMFERLLAQGIVILAREPPGLLPGRRSSASFHKAVAINMDKQGRYRWFRRARSSRPS
ncbi:hypothetical protein P168DRAFT_5999 [Aspergillus campestris IBT 28561]|uniref:Uncharacterized protein n=1 Tax=Aspergillus campestris (strain IBT 28561) TaxID=1392248 RepID=A0A2I1DDP3_ASPC2|nr:uncharacterized protein P168DRAFT_5999 [Aspergillus campestris IBT 28561]PKY07985.1 hypothetical protein P168DRAFT_5999 [Aspergillus campestris IBT 28561]